MSLVLAVWWFLIYSLGVYSPTLSGEPAAQHYLWIGPYASAASCAIEAATTYTYHNGPLVSTPPTCIGVPSFP